MNSKIKVASLQGMLMQKEGLPLRYAAMIATTVAHEFDAELLEGVAAWMDGTLTPDFSYEGCSIQDVMDDTDANLFEALYMLHIQSNHPEYIEDALWVVQEGGDLIGIEQPE